MKSQTSLYRDLCEILPLYFSKAPEVRLNHSLISNETYGRDSHIYVQVPESETRRKIEDELTRRGHKVCHNYHPTGRSIDVRVSYFRGRGWNE